MNDRRRVLLVGGAGYVGNVMSRRMLAAGWEVTVLDRLIFDHGSAIAPLLEDEAFTFVHGDLRDEVAVESSLAGVDSVVLLAGLVGDPITRTYPELSDSIHLGGCARLVEMLDGRGLDRFVFTSPSTDFRSHSTRVLRPEDIPNVTSSGPISAFVGIAVGFGSNFLSAVRSDKRICLQNGYHRTFALRCAGLKYAYCVVEDVTRKDELRLTADDSVAEDPEFYFASKRPPLIKDFFDRRLAKCLRVRPMQNHLEVEIKVRSGVATPWN